MSRQANSPPEDRCRFRIVLRHQLSDRFLSSFEGLSADDGSASAVIADLGSPGELAEVLERLANLAVEVVAVEQVG